MKTDRVKSPQFGELRSGYNLGPGRQVEKGLYGKLATVKSGGESIFLRNQEKNRVLVFNESVSPCLPLRASNSETHYL